MYKGYRIVEKVIHDYQHPDTRMVLDAPCEDQVQPGHPYCSTSPVELRDDPNVVAVLENNSWFWQYVGPDTVD